jgi:hypothetical protein
VPNDFHGDRHAVIADKHACAGHKRVDQVSRSVTERAVRRDSRDVNISGSDVRRHLTRLARQETP